jgi:hypothetical protein
VTGLVQTVVAAPDDGSLGPLLRLADDRLPPGAGYGVHAHRAVDVVALVVEGSLRHAWERGAVLRAGDVAVLRAGTGLEHDEVAGDDGARVLQAYLRAADPAAPAAHEVHPRPAGWVDLGRSDARLWVGPGIDVPPGLLVVPGDPATATPHAGGPVSGGPAVVAVWQLEAGRPAWAQEARRGT